MIRRLPLLLVLALVLSFSLPAPASADCGAGCFGDDNVCCHVEGFPSDFCMSSSGCQVMQDNARASQSKTTGSPAAAETQDENAAAGTESALVNPLKVDSVPEFLHLLLKAAVNLGSIILILMLVYVGFLFVVAQGNDEKLSQAKSALMWTVIGGLVLLGAEAISLVIQATVESLQ